MKPLRVGIVGAGWMATDYHIPAFSTHPRTEVVAIAELDSEWRRRVAERYSIPHAYPTASALLEAPNLDIVSICTPPHTHEEIFVAAARNNCDILCEKPFSTDRESARRMADAAREAGVFAQIGYLHRYYENFRKVLTIAHEGLLGQLLEFRAVYHTDPPEQSWYYDAESAGGGVVRDLAPHLLDFCFELFEERPTVEGGETSHLHADDVEDEAAIRLQFGDSSADISLGWTQRTDLARNILVGTEGWIEFNFEELEGAVGDEKVTFERGELPLIDLRLTELFPATTDDAHTKRIHDFADNVVRGGDPTSTPDRGVAIASTIDDVYDLAGETR